MKKIFLVFLIALVYSHAFGIDVQGDIQSTQNWIIGNSPYNLTGDVRIQSTTLNIEENIVVNLNGYNIYVTYRYLGSDKYTTKPGILNATGVTFNSGSGGQSSIIYDGHEMNSTIYNAAGVLDQCTFENVTLDIQKYSTPTFTGCIFTSSGGDVAISTRNGSSPFIEQCTISGFDYPFAIISSSLPTLTNNNTTGCTFEKVQIAGEFSKRLFINQQYIELDDQYILANTNYPYILSNDVTIKGIVFTIENNVTVELNGHTIFVQHLYNRQQSEVYPSQLNATRVNFTGDDNIESSIEFEGYRYENNNYWSAGDIEQCTFDRAFIHCTWYSRPTIFNSAFTSNLNGNAIVCSYSGQPELQSNTFMDYQYPLAIVSHGNPNITGNNQYDCVNSAIALSGEFKSLYSYKNVAHQFDDTYQFGITELPYQLVDELSFIGKDVEIGQNIVFDLNSQNMYIRPDVDTEISGDFVANGAIFTDSDGSGQVHIKGLLDDNGSPIGQNVTITQCTIENAGIQNYYATGAQISYNEFNSSVAGTAIIAHYGSGPNILRNTFTGYEFAYAIDGNTYTEIHENIVSGCQHLETGLSGEFRKQYYDYELDVYVVMADSAFLPSNAGPFYLTGDLKILGNILTIQSGNYIEMNDHQINIGFEYLDYTTCAVGSLIANNVYFANISELAKIQMNGIDYSGVQYYTHCSIDSARFYNVNLEVQHFSVPEIKHSNFSSTSEGGAAVELKFGSGITLQNNIFTGFDIGINVKAECDPLIEYNDFFNISEYAVKNNTSVVINAMHNYWGDASGPKYNTNPGGRGASITDYVNYSPFVANPINTYIPSVVINEIMYNPLESDDLWHYPFVTNDALRYIELYNADTVAVNLRSWSIGITVVHHFRDDLILQPNEYLVLCENPDAMQRSYGPISHIIPWMSFLWIPPELLIQENRITLKNSDSVPVDNVILSNIPASLQSTDGQGPSMELMDYTSDNNDLDNWAVSDSVFAPFGTPGALNSVCMLQNHLPQFITGPTTEAYVGYSYLYPALAIDIENDPLTFRLETDAPFLQIDQTTGLLSGTPGESDKGNIYSVSLQVSDDAQNWVSQNFDLHVMEFTYHIVINEIATGIAGGPGLQYIELYNADSTAYDLGQWALESGGRTCIINETIELQSGEYIVFSNDTTSIRDINPAIQHNKTWQTGFVIDSTVVLRNIYGQKVDATPVFPIYSLNVKHELVNPLLDNAKSYAWMTPIDLTGTPGAINSVYHEELNYPPYLPGLVGVDKDSVTLDGSINIRWNSAYDHDGDDMVYSLWLQCDECQVDTTFTGITDTSYVLNTVSTVFPGPGTVSWCVVAADGIFEIASQDTLSFVVTNPTGIDDGGNRPLTFDLSQNYPNPFNPVTTIAYSLAENTHVNLTIFNVNGQVVHVLVNSKQSKGTYQVNWNTAGVGSKVSSGVYFYRLKTDQFTETKKMILIE